MRRLSLRVWSCFLLSLAGQLSAAEPLAMSIVYAEYPPYSGLENGQPVGLEVDILNEALSKRMGIALTHTVLPWARAQLNVKIGAADAFVATLNPERLAYAVVSTEEVSHWQVSLFIRKGDLRFKNVNSMSQLSSFKIGSLIGNQWVGKQFADMHINYVARMELLPEMLLAGRIDVIPENAIVMRYQLKTTAMADRVQEVPLGVAAQGMYLHIGKQSVYAPIAQRFDATLLAMRKDGTFARIQNKYQQRQ